MMHLNSNDIYPIHLYYEQYSEKEIFTIIEILYDKIGYYNTMGKFETKSPKEQFSTHINNLLNRYKDGYFLNEKYGFVMEQPNEALKALMQTELPESLEEPVLKKLRTAAQMFYKFNSNEEEKKKAINILADILEPIREDLKVRLNDEYNIKKDTHDKIIFEIVNKFNIRHNDDRQLKEYSKSIWYDWMMQYYFSVIIAYYRLIN